MITATIGKIFLEAYNKKYGKKYDAKTFFVEVYNPLFFGGSKYLQWVQNSPFVQGLVSTSKNESGYVLKNNSDKSLTFKSENDAQKYIDEQKIPSKDILEIQKEKNKSQFKVIRKLKPNDFNTMLNAFLEKVDNCITPDASIAPGFPASEEKEFATTSGQVTNLNLETDKDDIFLSWIGSSLGVGLQGGLSILFPEPIILLDLYEGWEMYRKVITENDRLRGNQVNTWNGQWLAHRYSKYFRQEQPMADFTPFETTNDGMSVATQSWTKVLIGVSWQFDNPKMMGYVYNLGQTNTTIGFIPFSLEHIRRPIQLYAKLFGIDEGKKAEDLWGTENGFRACCQRGAIGIEAMQPKGLRQYMKAEKDKTVRLPKYDDKQVINFHTYQIWLLAMLNNEELWTKSIEFAQMLQEYVNKDKKLSTKRGNLVKTILASTSKRAILSALSEIVSDVEAFNEIEENAKIIHLMPTDNVPYYLTLIRFHYAGMSNKNNH